MEVNSDAALLLSSPPRHSIKSPQTRRISRSGGSMRSSSRPEYRHLSSGSRASRNNEAPWRKRFLEQCVNRANEARDASRMARRQLFNLSKNNQQVTEITDQEIRAIVQQEWARFRNEMEKQSIEYGFLDESIIGDIESDIRMSDTVSYGSHDGYDMDMGGMDGGMDARLREYEEMEEYERWEQYEDEIMEAELAYLQDLGSTANNQPM
ncbi:hypothetical protein GQ54DRAFT_111729 [Martensiomyces pterosporus]|nr:hypothetical protein GQ54DRAFT_111729 [Martensiomyces pterosporus]